MFSGPHVWNMFETLWNMFSDIEEEQPLATGTVAASSANLEDLLEMRVQCRTRNVMNMFSGPHVMFETLWRTCLVGLMFEICLRLFGKCFSDLEEGQPLATGTVAASSANLEDLLEMCVQCRTRNVMNMFSGPHV